MHGTLERRPEHVAIVGLGPSAHHYIDIVEAHGGRHACFDETWVINTYGDVLAHDRVFHMDDIRFTLRDSDPKIVAMTKWLRTHPGPVYTSRPHEDFPGMVAYPLEAVLNDAGFGYLNNSVAYAVAFALHLKVPELSLFGCDYAYGEALHEGKGRACTEYWLGVACARGMKIMISDRSTLLDSNEPSRRFYGYEAVKVDVSEKDGKVSVGFTPRKAVKALVDLE
jgi:hypothetical protein